MQSVASVMEIKYNATMYQFRRFLFLDIRNYSVKQYFCTHTLEKEFSF